jgi:hypothetical protein
VHLSSGRAATVTVDELEIEVGTRSRSVVTDVVCELHLDGFEWSTVISEPIDPGKTVTRKFPPLRPFGVGVDSRDLRANANFTFPWMGTHGQGGTVSLP